jgi:hypothetical protein
MGAPVHSGLPDELRLQFPSLQLLKNLYGMTEVMLMASWDDHSALGVPDTGNYCRTTFLFSMYWISNMYLSPYFGYVHQPVSV